MMKNLLDIRLELYWGSPNSLGSFYWHLDSAISSLHCLALKCGIHFSTIDLLNITKDPSAQKQNSSKTISDMASTKASDVEANMKKMLIELSLHLASAQDLEGSANFSFLKENLFSENLKSLKDKCKNYLVSNQQFSGILPIQLNQLGIEKDSIQKTKWTSVSTDELGDRNE